MTLIHYLKPYAYNGMKYVSISGIVQNDLSISEHSMEPFGDDFGRHYRTQNVKVTNQF